MSFFILLSKFFGLGRSALDALSSKDWKVAHGESDIKFWALTRHFLARVRLWALVFFFGGRKKL
jgi:hypothetical protein